MTRGKISSPAIVAAVLETRDCGLSRSTVVDTGCGTRRVIDKRIRATQAVDITTADILVAT